MDKIDYSIEIFLNKIYILLDMYALFQKISKYKFRDMPWIISGLQKSASVKKQTSQQVY